MRLNLVFVLIVLSMFYFIVPILILVFVNNDRKYSQLKRIYLSLFFIALFFGVFCKIDITNEIIFIGFDLSGCFFNKLIITKFPKFKLDIIINLLMLMPIGEFVFLDKIKNRKKYTVFTALSFGIFIGFVIELLQFMLPVVRIVQISDIIYNGISVLLGYILFAIFFYIKEIINMLFKKT